MNELYLKYANEAKGKSIGVNLRRLREKAQLSAKDIPDLLKSRGFEIKYSTYMGYENNNSIPNADIFLALCDILQVSDVLRSFGYGNDRFPSFSTSSLLSVPYFSLIEDFCIENKIDSKPVFDYFFSPESKADVRAIFNKGKPKIPDEIAVANILKLNNHDSIYLWGAQKGIWDPSLTFPQLSDDEQDLVIAYRKQKKERERKESSVS